MVYVQLAMDRQQSCGQGRLVKPNAGRVLAFSSNNNRNSEVDEIRQEPPKVSSTLLSLVLFTRSYLTMNERCL